METSTQRHTQQQYIYCKVRFSSTRFPLSYLTEDESVRAGDFVKVPFGKENEERVGLVVRVIPCTREDAPYPPEKTKHVLGKTEQPKNWDVPKQKKTRERAEPQARNAAKEETAEQRKPQARVEPQKKKGIGGKCLAFALLVILGITIGWLLPDKNAGSVQPVPSQTNYNESDREEEISEEALKELYSGKLPEEGMPLRALRYTSLGEPDERILCRDYDRMDKNHKQVTVQWYRKDGSLLASGLCFQLKSEQELTLHSFTYFDQKDDANASSNDTAGPKIPWEGIREEYDNPEDLWEDNPGDYDDEDEAWDEWYDDGDEPYDD